MLKIPDVRALPYLPSQGSSKTTSQKHQGAYRHPEEFRNILIRPPAVLQVMLISDLIHGFADARVTRLQCCAIVRSGGSPFKICDNPVSDSFHFSQLRGESQG